MKATRWVGMAIVAAVVGAAAVTVSAAPVSQEFGPNLVTNSGFEAGLAGWTTNGFFAQGFDYGIDNQAHSGNNAFYGGAIGGLGFLSQNIPTTPGTNYNIHFWLASDGFLPNELQVLWGGASVFDRMDIFPQGYTQIIIDPRATAAMTTLSLGFRSDSGLLHVDDISIRVVPEPASVWLLGIALAGIGFSRRKAQ